MIIRSAAALLALVSFVQLSFADGKPRDLSYSQVSSVFEKELGDALITRSGLQNSFVLDDRAPLRPVYRLKDSDRTSVHQAVFGFNYPRYVAQSGAKDLLEAKTSFYSKQEFLSASQDYSRPYPYLYGWGSLFHPPVRKLQGPLELVSRDFAKQTKKIYSPFLSASIQKSLDSISQSELTIGNKITFLHNSQASVEQLKMIKSAEKSILIAAIMVDCDVSSENLITEIEKKAQSGVDVRVAVDKYFGLLSKKCEKRLKKSGVKFAKDIVHGTIWVVDGAKAIVGTQSLMRDFVQADGFNFLSRDTDVLVEGPAVTDILREYVAMWGEIRSDDVASMTSYLPGIKARYLQEVTAGKRGSKNYGQWFGSQPSELPNTGICRVFAQHPKGRKTAYADLIQASARLAKDQIRFSTTKFIYNVDQFDPASPSDRIIRELKRKATVDGVRVDLIANGVDGGNGELNMGIQRLIQEARDEGRTLDESVLRYLDEVVAEADAKKSYLRMFDFIKTPGIRAWTYFNFYHLKHWNFDRVATLFGSVNFDDKSFNKRFEIGMQCMDRSVQDQYEAMTALDLVNSIPVVNQ